MQSSTDHQAEVRGTVVLDNVSEGWKVNSNANNAPRGYRFICNNKSRWSGEYKRALVPDEVAYEWKRNHS